MGCPKCGSTDLWEDNFWSGCNKCKWMKSFESDIKLSLNITVHVIP